MAKFLITQGNVDYRIDAEHYEVSEGMLDLYKKDNIIAGSIVQATNKLGRLRNNNSPFG